MRCCCYVCICDWLISPQIICSSQSVMEMLPIQWGIDGMLWSRDTPLLKMILWQKKHGFWLFLTDITTNQTQQHQPFMHRRTWLYLAASDHVCSQMYVVWSSMVTIDHYRWAKANPEWTNSDHVQPGSFEDNDQAHPTRQWRQTGLQLCWPILLCRFALYISEP